MSNAEQPPDPGPGELLIERDGAVAVVTLNRPEVRNALSRRLLAELGASLHQLAQHSEVRAIVLTGAGQSFSAGADLKEAPPSGAKTDFWYRYDKTDEAMQLYRSLPRLPVPVIAAVNGHALGGGCGLAMSCDLVLAADSAEFGYPEIRWGLVAALVMVNLSRVVGRRHALDLLLSGRRIGAEEARALGMVNRVVPEDRLMSEALDYAHELAERSPTAVRITKELHRRVSELDFDRAMELARDANQLAFYARRDTPPENG